MKHILHLDFEQDANSEISFSIEVSEIQAFTRFGYLAVLMYLALLHGAMSYL